MVDKSCKVLYYFNKSKIRLKNQHGGKNVSSEIYEIFDALPPDERKTFIAHVKAAVQAGGFNLDKLMEAKNILAVSKMASLRRR